jgi:hypothetical protein
MANNRLYLKTANGAKKILLAKYYPSTGWYMYHSQEKLDEFLESLGDGSMWGPTDLKLEWEIKTRRKSIIE